MTLLETKHLNAFERAIRAAGKRRLNDRALWGIFAQSFPGRPQGAEDRRWFLTALQELESRGVIRLPSKKGDRWNLTLLPPLPRSVDVVIAAPPTPRRSWRSFPWHTRLSWIPDLPQLSAEHERFLRKVHEGLTNGRFAQRAPLKYRSLQLTGDEKRLGTLLQSSLFGNERLSLDLIGCFQEVPPLAWADISDAPAAIIFENAGPFSVARDVLRRISKSPYGIVVYGGGNGILAALPHLLLIGRPIAVLHYVGDLDIAGLEIALRAREVARRVGLPEVVAAPGAHLKMLQAAGILGQPAGWKVSAPRRLDSNRLQKALQFLPTDALGSIQKVIESGNRIPEEALGPDELSDLFNSRTSRATPI